MPYSPPPTSHAHTQQPTPTAANATALDTVWDATEMAVVNNVRTRVNELETALRNLGLIA